jgi:uncharacterized tellurite resistance protein B-like protein
MNKAVAGYHMLSILSSVDGDAHVPEDKVILQYINENYTEAINAEKELELVQSIKREDYPIHFNNAMNDFYMDSTAEERTHFLDLAVKLVIADNEVSHVENLFLNELFNAWEANYTF